MEVAAACAVLGVPVDLERLFYKPDPVYRLIVSAVMNRANEMNKTD